MRLSRNFFNNRRYNIILYNYTFYTLYIRRLDRIRNTLLYD